MDKLLKIKPESKDGLIENLSEALEEARKGKMESIVLVYTLKNETTFYGYDWGNIEKKVTLLELRKKMILEDFKTTSEIIYNGD